MRVQVIDHEGMSMPVSLAWSVHEMRVMQRKVGMLVLHHLGIVGGPEHFGEQDADQRYGPEHR